LLFLDRPLRLSAVQTTCRLVSLRGLKLLYLFYFIDAYLHYFKLTFSILPS
jgi:hypothetical protein